MKSLRAHLTEYIATRRALGTQLQEPANTLRGFIRFLGRRRAKFITIPLALEWSQQSKNVQHATWARKLSMVRQFARWLSVLEPRHQVPPPRLLNVRHRRNQPHIYSDAEMVSRRAQCLGSDAQAGRLPGACLGELYILVHRSRSGTTPVGNGVRADHQPRRATMSAVNLAGYLQRFFTDRLLAQLGASHHTVASYRDTFRLLLKFASKHYHRQASDLEMEDLDTRLVCAFLKHLEHDRHNRARTRNNRLSAIHAFFGYVGVNEPALARHCQRILAIPLKRFERGPVEFLSREETAALIKAPDATTWLGRRDQLLLQVAVQTGLRNSELIRLRRQDLQLGSGAHIKCLGKGRKTRCTPLRAELAACLSDWIAQQPPGLTTPVFPTSDYAASTMTRFSISGRKRMVRGRHAA
jgi:integrase/recombinase XerD